MPKNAKVHTGSFYLDSKILHTIEYLSQYLNVSRSIIVERSLYGKEEGYEKAKRHIMPKKKKEISFERGKYKKIKKSRKKTQYEQKSLFDYVCL
ncbi:hypothetical protein LS68_009315 [Helicobacter sp. MIT 05-5293]|uniref:hypothetical protein n=1 Tax=unclassified Helicobacter TaxID=2593540 RepID=UPI00051D8599|nr:MULTISPECIES: hypothetical protein [unclassified Helicobacter]TLD79858.1 hypothetical protein LS68_009315 [Helicobacter sp. MIT 05-5293]TLD85531.1 hypothetical protein LS69_009065 [Helicobacter sp. MIT 05-5294]